MFVSVTVARQGTMIMVTANDPNDALCLHDAMKFAQAALQDENSQFAALLGKREVLALAAEGSVATVAQPVPGGWMFYVDVEPLS